MKRRLFKWGLLAGALFITLLAYSTTSARPQVIWKTAEKDGTVFFTFRNGEIIAAGSRDGHLLWEHRIGTVMLNGATPVNGKEAIVTDVDGNIQLLRSGSK